MNKQEFLNELRKGLRGLPPDDIEERLTFYGEMIDDRTEEGLSEEEAVAAIGDANEIIRQTVADIPLAKIARERIKPKRRLKAWEIVLLAVGSPIWLSLGIAAFAVIFALYVALWAIIVALWAVFGAFAVSFPACIAASVIFISGGNAVAGVAVLAAGIVCAGLSVFAFFGCRAATKGAVVLAKKIALQIKNRFIKKEEA